MGARLKEVGPDMCLQAALEELLKRTGRASATVSLGPNATIGDANEQLWRHRLRLARRKSGSDGRAYGFLKVDRGVCLARVTLFGKDGEQCRHAIVKDGSSIVDDAHTVSFTLDGLCPGDNAGAAKILKQLDKNALKAIIRDCYVMEEVE